MIKSNVLQFLVPNISTVENMVDIMLNDNYVEWVTYTEFSGLNVDEHLSWKFQEVNYITKILHCIKSLTDSLDIKQYCESRCKISI